MLWFWPCATFNMQSCVKNDPWLFTILNITIYVQLFIQKYCQQTTDSCIMCDKNKSLPTAADIIYKCLYYSPWRNKMQLPFFPKFQQNPSLSNLFHKLHKNYCKFSITKMYATWNQFLWKQENCNMVKKLFTLICQSLLALKLFINIKEQWQKHS